MPLKLKKILIVATSDIHLQVFHIPYLELLRKMGCVIDVAIEVRGNGLVPFTDRVYNFPFKRTLFTFKLFKAYWNLKKLIDSGNYDVIHCHTPIPAALTRLASRGVRKKGTRLIYTAHGFHFYKGGPLLSWLVYYPIEKYLSKLTDAIITINKEDYDVALNKFNANQTYYMKGIGVNPSKFNSDLFREKNQLRASLSYSEQDFILIYVANFIDRKNHVFILKSLIRIKNLIPNIKVLFAGSGILLEKMKEFTRLNNIEGYVNFLGFRNDVDKLLAISDVSISASKHEGLGLALAEAMFSGIPVVATRDRGHQEMIENNFNGFLFEHGNQQQFIDCIMKLYTDRELNNKFIQRSLIKVEQFSISNSLNFMDEVYRKYLN